MRSNLFFMFLFFLYQFENKKSFYKLTSQTFKGVKNMFIALNKSSLGFVKTITLVNENIINPIYIAERVSKQSTVNQYVKSYVFDKSLYKFHIHNYTHYIINLFKQNNLISLVDNLRVLKLM